MLLYFACVAAGPEALPLESDRPFARQEAFVGLPGELHLDGTTLRSGAAVLALDVYEAPVLGPTVVHVAHEHQGTGRLLRFEYEGTWLPQVLLDAGGRPDRLVLAPDGQTVAFVWGALASVWTVRPGEPPVQRTNLGLAPGGGRPPRGFLPPPRTAPSFVGDLLTWPGGEARWR